MWREEAVAEEAGGMVGAFCLVIIARVYPMSLS